MNIRTQRGVINSGLPPSPLVKPGMGITAVTRCIWFGGLPPHVGEAVLFKEASLMGDVHFVVFPDCPGRDEAMVTFASFGYGYHIVLSWLSCHTELVLPRISPWQ